MSLSNTERQKTAPPSTSCMLDKNQCDHATEVSLEIYHSPQTTLSLRNTESLSAAQQSPGHFWSQVGFQKDL